MEEHSIDVFYTCGWHIEKTWTLIRDTYKTKWIKIITHFCNITCIMLTFKACDVVFFKFNKLMVYANDGSLERCKLLLKRFMAYGLNPTILEVLMC